MRYAALLLAATLMTPAIFAAQAAHTAPATDAAADVPLTTNFSVDAKTMIPGGTIGAGRYTISIVEHLTDRVILRISDKDGKVKSMFLGLTKTGLPDRGNSGPILWTGKGESALRGFAFPNSPPVEFVYPKTEAVALAKSNSDKVLAIDPASDNLSVSHDNLSKQDMQIVTLWTLRSTRVGPDASPAIEAARYQVPPAPAAPAASPVYEASATPPPRMRPAATNKAVTVKRVQAEPVIRKPAIAALPHTASNLPLMLLFAVLALVGSAALRARRIYGREV